MAEHHVQGSFAFTCTAAESALIEEAWQHAADLLGNFTPGEPSAEFLAAFMPTDLGNPFNGLLGLFDDPAFPDFGAEIEIEGSVDCVVSIYGTTDFQPGPIAELIRHCCQESLKVKPVGFDWSYSCSRPLRDSFGEGGARYSPIMSSSRPRSSSWRDDWPYSPSRQCETRPIHGSTTPTILQSTGLPRS
ncbi:hypothetical protein ACFSUK_18660 [Sphingobium scionense]